MQKEIFRGVFMVLSMGSIMGLASTTETQTDPPVLSGLLQGSPIPNTPCGKSATTKTVNAESNTSDEDMATQLGWQANGVNNWHHCYTFEVTAPALNFGIHKNGGGNGSYQRTGTVEIKSALKWERTATYNANGELIDATPWVLVDTLYSAETKSNNPAHYTPCLTHGD